MFYSSQVALNYTSMSGAWSLTFFILISKNNLNLITFKLKTDFICSVTSKSRHNCSSNNFLLSLLNEHPHPPYNSKQLTIKSSVFSTYPFSILKDTPSCHVENPANAHDWLPHAEKGKEVFALRPFDLLNMNQEIVKNSIFLSFMLEK